MEPRKNIKIRAEVEHALQRKDIENLTAQVEEGFKGTHARQDIANGRTRKLEQWQSFMQGGMAVLALMVVPVLIYLITHWK